MKGDQVRQMTILHRPDLCLLLLLRSEPSPGSGRFFFLYSLHTHTAFTKSVFGDFPSSLFSSSSFFYLNPRQASPTQRESLYSYTNILLNPSNNWDPRSIIPSQEDTLHLSN